LFAPNSPQLRAFASPAEKPHVNGRCTEAVKSFVFERWKAKRKEICWKKLFSENCLIVVFASGGYFKARAVMAM